MELKIAIRHILDGDAVIIMGAGASFGAKNAYGDFPSGSRLAKDLYGLCSISPDDENDLQDAAQCYEEEHSTSQLITEIRSRLTCASFTPTHKTIYSQPWMRYYTTNYDDVALLSAKDTVSIMPVTLKMDFEKYRKYEHLCIHINGHIGNLNENTIHDEFKLTSNSYLSEKYITDSQWGDLLVNDLEAAKCIVIVGLSLKYDLDLSKIIFNSETVSKTVIIDHIGLTPNAENRLGRFGTVYKIGIDKFANEIEYIKSTYKPKAKNPVDKLYTCFTHEYHRQSIPTSATPSDVYNLFLSGQFEDSLVHKTNRKYDGLVYRSKFKDVFDAVLTGKKYIFIHSGMGNGKTICIQELKYKLSKIDMHVFTLSDVISTKLAEEVASICSITENVLIIVEDYFNYMDVLHAFKVNVRVNIQFIFTARSAINNTKMPDVFDLFSIKENESVIIDLNKLEYSDIYRCIDIFNQYGLFGKKSKMTEKEKYDYLRSKEGGHSQFQSIMLDVVNSDVMRRKVSNLVETIIKNSNNYGNAIILILLVQIMKLRISVTDIERITGLDISKDAMFRSNIAVQELLSFTDGKQSFVVKSPVVAKLILSNIAKEEHIISTLISLAEYSVKYSATAKYSNILISIISYSHINSFLKNFNNPKQFLATYYDNLSKMEFYNVNNFFWLQYAISCIEIADFPRAQHYLDVAYGLADDGFVPFQINNQQARLYLEIIIQGKSKKLLEDFKSAHRLLMLPIISEKDNEFNVVKLFGYYCRKEFVTKIKDDEQKSFYKQACKEAHERLSNYVHKHAERQYDFKELQEKLLKAYFAF